MSKIWSRVPPALQGAAIGVGVLFAIPPILWLLIRWWGLIFPKVML